MTTLDELLVKLRARRNRWIDEETGSAGWKPCTLSIEAADALEAAARENEELRGALGIAQQEIRSLGCDPDDIDLALRKVNIATIPRALGRTT